MQKIITFKNYNNINVFSESFNPETWFGFNLLAIDGTTLHVPDEPPISEQFEV